MNNISRATSRTTFFQRFHRPERSAKRYVTVAAIVK
jgi:hypothetical protein